MSVVAHFSTDGSGTDSTVTSSGGGTTVNVLKPTHTTDGDLLVAYFYSQASSGTLTIPSGWTASTQFTGRRGGVYYKAIPSASAETASNYTFGNSVTGRVCVIIFRVTGANLNAPFDIEAAATTEVTGSSPVVVPSVTPTTANTLALAFLYWNNSSTSVSTFATSGQTSIKQQLASPATGNTSGIAISTELLDGSLSPTGSQSFTTSPNAVNQAGFMLTIKPNATLNAGFSYSADKLNVSFTNTSSGQATSSWDFGDGSVADTTLSPIHYYAAPGTYTVTLTVTDGGGGSQSTSQNITITGVRTRYWDGTSWHEGKFIQIKTNGTRVEPDHMNLVLNTGPTWTQMKSGSSPIYIHHRGGSANYVEMSAEAYKASAFLWPQSALEISVQGGSDGTIWAHHDAYFDRMVLGSSGGTTMPIINYTAAQVASLQQTAQFTDNPNVPTRPVAKLTDLLALYGGKRVIFIEPKGNVSTSALLSLMSQYGGTDWFVWKWPGNTAIPAAVTSAGYDTWGYYFNGSDMTNFSATQGNFTFVGLDFNLSDSALSSAIATAGASRVIGHIIATTTQRDRLLTAGVRGLMVSAPRIVLPRFADSGASGGGGGGGGGTTQTPTPGLPFYLDTTALRSSPKKIFAHYFGTFPISIDDVQTTTAPGDYWWHGYMMASGEGGAHSAQGGYLRNRPLTRNPLGTGYVLKDAITDVQQAYTAGVDGFFCDILGAPGSGKTWTQYMTVKQAADQTYPDGSFKVIPMIDTNGSMVTGGASADTIAAAIYAFASGPSSYYLPDGRYLVSSFRGEGKNLAWWQAVFAALKANYGIDGAFMPAYLNINLATNYTGQSWTYGTSYWGDGADPNIQIKGTNNGAPVHARGEKYMAPIQAQNIRVYSSVFDEAYGTWALRAAWDRAVREQADYIQLVTWSDYSEGGEFNYSIANGSTLLDLTAYYATAWKLGSYPTILQDAIYLSHRDQLSSSTPTGGQTSFLQHWNRGANVTAIQDVVEVLTMLTSSAQVTVTIGGVNHTYTAPAGVNVQYYPLVAGAAPSAVAIRNGTAVAQITSSVAVLASPVKDDRQYFRFSSLRGTTGQFDGQVKYGY